MRLREVTDGLVEVLIQIVTGPHSLCHSR
jgi:hypothetical protein